MELRVISAAASRRPRRSGAQWENLHIRSGDILSLGHKYWALEFSICCLVHGWYCMFENTHCSKNIGFVGWCFMIRAAVAQVRLSQLAEWLLMKCHSIMLRLHVAGGVHNGEYVSWLYCYDPIMDVWARKQDMNTKRAIHTLAGMNDRLYAIGGNHLKGKSTSVSVQRQKTGEDCVKRAASIIRWWPWPYNHISLPWVSQLCDELSVKRTK